MVKRAVEYLKAHGKNRLLEEVNLLDKGQFIERDLYIMVCDVHSYKFIAHGVNVRVLNYDSRLTKDQNGRHYMTEVIDHARKQGEGWIEYVDDMVIGCGAYKM
jgi:hypothetical protein